MSNISQEYPFTVVVETITAHHEYPCRDTVEADHMIGMLLSGDTFPPHTILAANVTVDCPVHGYGFSDNGQCDACYDEWLATLPAYDPDLEHFEA